MKEISSPGSPPCLARPDGVGGELHFAHVSGKFPSHPRLFSPENKEISAPPPCGFLIGIYLFYKSWSTETFNGVYGV